MRYLMCLLLLLSFAVPTWAATESTEPVSMPAGTVDLAVVEVPLSGQLVTLAFTPTDFTDPGQEFAYMWQESEDQITWHDWTGGSPTGGVLDKSGSPILTFTRKGVSRFTGTVAIKLIGVYTGPTITIATSITY